MKLIERFVSRELIVNVLFAILVLSLVLVVGNIFRKLLPLLVNHDVPLEYLLTFIAYVLPFSLIFTIPWGLLTAILLVFGRLSADNELIALRSNGVSVTRVCLPLLVLAIISTAICLWLNVDVAPAAQEKLRSTIFDLATRNPIALFGNDQVIDQFHGEGFLGAVPSRSHRGLSMVYRILDAVTLLATRTVPFVRRTKDEFEHDRSPRISENREENHAS